MLENFHLKSVFREEKLIYSKFKFKTVSHKLKKKAFFTWRSKK